MKYLLTKEEHNYNNRYFKINYSMPRKITVYRGYKDRRLLYNLDKNPLLNYWTDKYEVAETYGYNIDHRDIQLKNAVWYDADGAEFNHSDGLVDQFQFYYEECLKDDVDVKFTRFGEEYLIPKGTDGIIIHDIVDIESGEIPLDEFDPNYEREKQRWASDIYLLPTKK